MYSRPPKTRYPLPELPEFVRLPEAPPWESPISELSGFWLKVQCDCGRSAGLPFRLLAAKWGWKVRMRQAVDRLRCGGCGSPPTQVIMVDRADGDGKSIFTRELVLVERR